MSTLHKVKAYFGMAPTEDYDDDYFEERAPAHPGYTRQRFDDGYGHYEGRNYDDPRNEPGDYPATGGYRGGYGDEQRYRPRDFDRAELGRPRFGMLRNSTRGALAMDPRRMAALFDEGSPLSKITTLRPKDYSEARTIGERFRDGTPVIMDLVTMDNADAKRLVDFAAGLAFALRGSFDKVATKVFLLSPADVDVTPEERRRIAETGFYAYQ
ncbi:MAG: cell division protein SepF [Mycobacterium sp.]|nr:cell division protein SepF [Mycobacterium sp.]